MKLLIVAHPDDEILWFNPEDFDKIIIIFGFRPEIEEINIGRKRMMEVHPYRERIEFWNLVDTKHFIAGNIKRTIEKRLISLAQMPYDTVFTHNQIGEYGHMAHIFLHRLVTKVFQKRSIFVPSIFMENLDTCLQIKKRNLKEFNLIKELYQSHKCWTINDKFLPNCFLSFQKII